MIEEVYAHPEMLAETEWLAENLGNASLRIVDARPDTDYLVSHIPGSVNIPIRGWNLKELERPDSILGPQAFKALMEELGIGDGTPVVAYDDDGGHYAARIWWAMEYYGHPNAVRLLNGGWNKWLAEGRLVTATTPEVAKAAFTPRPSSEVIATAQEVAEAIRTRDTLLLDVRSKAEFEGVDRRENKFGGRLPGAVHLEWTNGVTPDHLKSWKSASELRSMYEATGVRPGQPTITY